MYWGKIIGGLSGLVIGHGLIGGIAGLALGHWADGYLTRLLAKGKAEPKPVFADDRQQVFSHAVVALAAKLAKADGPVTRAEIDAFRSAFEIPEREREGIAALYDEAKRDPTGYEAYAYALADLFAGDSRSKSEILDALTKIALADGPIRPEEKVFLDRVGRIFGFFADAEPKALTAEGDPYALLGVSREADFTEVKAAWRRLTRENHPDTLMARGMSQEKIASATHTMAAINAAFDTIRTERGES